MMPTFRWPSSKHDIALATVVANRPQKPQDWDSIAATLSKHFSTEKRPVHLTDRACRDRLNLLLTKYKADDAQALKRYGTCV